ncbi:hypothetical protein PG991_007583 [Apiospora marii]|uniref:Uncharacterized protein n=1 Tax=Apiospora marii TaxID=335849 RepID=A0ABR1RVX6_9PEZI
MQGHPNEIKTQYVMTNLPKTTVTPPVETEKMRLQAIEQRKARDLELKQEHKHVNINHLMDRIVSDLPSNEFMAVSPNIFWNGGDNMTAYYEWLRDEYYDGDMPEIVRRANAFRGFPQLDDEDFNPLGAAGAAERRAYYRSEKGREKLRPYLPTIKKYASAGEYILIEAQVNGQTALEALDAAAAAAAAKGEPYWYSQSPVQESLAPSVPGTLAVDDLSTQLDRSATLGRTPQETVWDSSIFPTPNPAGLSPKGSSVFEVHGTIKDEPTPSTVSGYFPTHQALFVKDEHKASAEKEDEHNDEEVEDEDDHEDEDKDMSAADLATPLAPTPEPTPTKKPSGVGSKRKELDDGAWKPSPAGGMPSTNDDEPLIKRVKQSHRGTVRR